MRSISENDAFFTVDSKFKNSNSHFQNPMFFCAELKFFKMYTS